MSGTHQGHGRLVGCAACPRPPAQSTREGTCPRLLWAPRKVPGIYCQSDHPLCDPVDDSGPALRQALASRLQLIGQRRRKCLRPGASSLASLGTSYPQVNKPRLVCWVRGDTWPRDPYRPAYGWLTATQVGEATSDQPARSRPARPQLHKCSQLGPPGEACLAQPRLLTGQL